jgi:hypothetical protein
MRWPTIRKCGILEGVLGHTRELQRNIEIFIGDRYFVAGLELVIVVRWPSVEIAAVVNWVTVMLRSIDL